MRPTSFLVLVCFISVCAFINTVYSQDTQCCCTNGYRYNAPISVTEECLYQHDYFTEQWSADYNGYASRTDSCGNCICGVYCTWNSGFFVGTHQDVYGILYSRSAYDPNCGNTVQITRAWDFACDGVTETVFQVISIVDTIYPELFVPPARTQECVSTDGVAGPEYDLSELDNYFGSARATDLCTNPILTENTPTVTGNTCSLQISRSWSAFDGCLTSTGTQSAAFVDTTPPIITSSLGSVLTFTCDNTAAYAAGNVAPTATDSCDNSIARLGVLSEVTYEGRCTGEYSIERTWYADDACNNRGYYIQTIIVEDPDPPAVTLNGVNGAVNHYYESNCNIPAPNTYVVADTCTVSGPTYLTYEETITGLSEFESHFDVIRSYRATDDCGNYVEWQDVVNVNRGSSTYTVTGPNEVTAAKGTNIALPYLISEFSCTDGYILFDIGAAEFVSITLFTGCTNTNGGPIYCPVPAGTANSFVLTINVPTTYAPDFLEVRQATLFSDPTLNIGYNYYSRVIIQLT